MKLRGVCHADPREARRPLDPRHRRGARSSGQPTAGRARIDVGGTASRPDLMDGDRVVLWAELRAPRGLRDPGAFDAAAQARRDGIHAAGWCKSPRLVEATGERDAGWLRDLAARARRWSRARLVAALPPGREQALVRAMVLGDRTALDRGDLRDLPHGGHVPRARALRRAGGAGGGAAGLGPARAGGGSARARRRAVHGPRLLLHVRGRRRARRARDGHGRGRARGPDARPGRRCREPPRTRRPHPARRIGRRRSATSGSSSRSRPRWASSS